MAAPFTIGLIQMAPASTVAASLEKAAERIEAAAKAGAQVICQIGRAHV